jgi:Fic family protein
LIKLFFLSDEISIEDVQKILGVSRATASRKMDRWFKKGIVKRLGKTRAIRYKKKEI